MLEFTVLDSNARVLEQARHAQTTAGEQSLLLPLLIWAEKHGYINSRSILRAELPWNGRRIDLAAKSKSGRLTAFELKLGSVSRVLEQAAFNRMSFNRSFAVIGHRPAQHYLDAAHDFGIGVIVITHERVQLEVSSPYRGVPAIVRRRLTNAILGGSKERHV